MSVSRSNLHLSSEINEYLNTVYSQGESGLSFNSDQCDPDKIMDEDQNKLLELTAQCINYYNRYSHEKDTHTVLVGKAFQVLKSKVEESFQRLIDEAKNKEIQLLQLLDLEKQKLIQEKNFEEERLNEYLKQIKEVHLTKLLNKTYKDEQSYSSYAQTLEGFFIVMTEVQKNKFQDSLQQCLTTINSLVKKDVDRLLTQNRPTKLQDLIYTYRDNPEGSFTFDIQRQAVVPDEFIDQIQRKDQESLMSEVHTIRERQKLRESKLGLYERMLALGMKSK